MGQPSVIPPEARRKDDAATMRADRRLLRTGEAQQQLEQLWALAPPLPHVWPVQLKHDAFYKFARWAYAVACPKGQAAPKESWITPWTWMMIQMTSRARKDYFTARDAAAVAAAAAAATAPETYDVQAAAAAAAATAATAMKSALRSLSRQTGKAVRADRAQWVVEQAESVARDLAAGRQGALWQFARQVQGKKHRRAAVVLKDDRGNPIVDKQVLVEQWEKKFFSEFGSKGVILEEAEWQEQLSTISDHTGQNEHAAEVPSTAWFRDATADAVSAMQAGRAVGEDGVPAEVLKAAGPRCSECLADVIRAAVCEGLPWQWRSGQMTPVPKKARIAMSLQNSRGVLLASHGGKALAKVARKQLVPALEQAGGDWQSGAVQGGGVETPYMLTHAFMEWLRARGCSGAVLFTDVKAAFYTISCELAVGALMTAEQRAQHIEACGLTGQTAAAVNAIAAEAPDIVAAGVPAAWRGFARDWHLQASFRVSGSSRRVVPSTGVRPGDPLADVVFALSFLHLQKSLRDELALAGLCFEVPVANSLFSPDAGGTAAAPMPTYMDDLAVLLVSDDPRELPSRLAQATRIVHKVCRSFLLELNLEAGKTEALMVLRGPSAALVREAMAASYEGSTLHLDVGLAKPLRVVAKYKHLGVQAAMGATQLAEVSARCSAAKAVTGALRKRVLADPRLPRKNRLQVAKAAVHSVLFLRTGCRARPAAGQSSMIYTAAMQPIRAVHEAARRADPDQPRTADAEVRRELAVPHPEAEVIADRLRLLARLSGSRSQALLGLLRAPGSEAWRGDALKDLGVLKAMLPGKLEEFPQPTVEPAMWEQFWTKWPAQWKQLIKQFLAKVAADEAAFLRACAAQGIRPMAGQMPGEIAEEDLADDGWMCGDCGQLFATHSRLAAHRGRLHGHRDPLRLKVACSQCPFCDVDFITRLRLRRHLSWGAAACVRRVPELMELPASMVEEADAKERHEANEAKRNGLDKTAGPPIRRAAAAPVAAALAAADGNGGENEAADSSGEPDVVLAVIPPEARRMDDAAANGDEAAAERPAELAAVIPPEARRMDEAAEGSRDGILPEARRSGRGSGATPSSRAKPPLPMLFVCRGQLDKLRCR